MHLDFPGAEARRGDEIDRFILFVDQLELAIQLLNGESVARQRMALVALDNLAEILLSEFAQECFLSADLGPSMWSSRESGRLSAVKRRSILSDFGRKVTLAGKTSEERRTWGYIQPLLEEYAATVFRVAHRYRNEVYHAGQHNLSLLQPLGRLYAQAVAQTFVRSLPEGRSVGGGIAPRLAELDRFDWREAGRGRDWFAPNLAAKQIVRKLCQTISIDGESLRTRLADDIGQRCAIIDADLQELAAQGLGKPGIRSMLESAQLWGAHRGDEELIRLEEEHLALIEEVLRPGAPAHTLRIGLHENQRRQFARVQDLRRCFSFGLHLDTTSRLCRKAERLRTKARSLPALVEQYQRIDDELQQMESAAEWMVRQWDREVQLQDEIARGK